MRSSQLLALAQDVPPGTIRQALSCFSNAQSQNPGRYNFIDGWPFDMLLDYAHNPDGVREICAISAQLPVSGKRRLLSLNIGNRHKAHFAELAPLLAKTFDSFVIGCERDRVKHCRDYAGDDPVAAMLRAARQSLVGNGVGEDTISCEADQAKTLAAILDQAKPGDLVVLLVEYGKISPLLKGRKALVRAASDPPPAPARDSAPGHMA
jgi:cyanophycin synthetase